MSVGYINSAWSAARQFASKTQRAVPGSGFASRMQNADVSRAQRCIAGTGSRIQAADRYGALAAYIAASAGKAPDVTPAYQAYTSENYEIVPDNEANGFVIRNGEGESLGFYFYSDIKIRQDTATGKQFLISENGTMWYDALVMDAELRDALQKAMGVDSLETETLQGYTVYRHSGTGIQYLIRDGEEGRGGKVLLQSEADAAKYEALAETYLTKYPNLITNKEAAYIWASLEIRGMAQRTEQGILSIHFDGVSYSDNDNTKNNWCIRFSEEVYKTLNEYLKSRRMSQEETQQSSVWQDILQGLGCKYERVWSKEEEEQGYLNN